MAQEIDLGGTIYVSSKRASELTGYAQDYIGQISRAGHIDAKKISGLWYVQMDSLKAYKEKADAYKPEPPARGIQGSDFDMSISFDGRDYVSAARAAKLTGYATDYVGQLAREGTILARLIGNRWFVDRDGIVEHKREKDALLASVQAQSVGLAKAEDIAMSDAKPQIAEEEELHFRYQTEEVDLIPALPERESEVAAERVESAQQDVDFVETESEERAIPIRVVEPVPHIRTFSRDAGEVDESAAVAEQSSYAGMTRILVAIVPVIVAVIGVAGLYMIDPAGVQRAAQSALASAQTLTGGMSGSDGEFVTKVQQLFAKKLRFERNPL